MDLVFALDATSSLDENQWMLEKRFAADLVTSFAASNPDPNFRVGALMFAGFAVNNFILGTHGSDYNTIRTEILSIHQLHESPRYTHPIVTSHEC